MLQTLHLTQQEAWDPIAWNSSRNIRTHKAVPNMQLWVVNMQLFSDPKSSGWESQIQKLNEFYQRLS